MKTNDKKELQSKALVELRKLLKDATQVLLSLQLDKEQGKLKSTRDIFFKRKEIAIIKTIMRKKEVESATSKQTASA